MSAFVNLTPTNGFDQRNLNNARQNNYAWSVAELDGYLYIGTGRNILLNIIKTLAPNAQIPALIMPNRVNNLAEIWRYKKDGSLPWERVYKAPIGSGITGFRFMLSAPTLHGSPSLFAAALGPRVSVLKSTNGVNWFILPDEDEILQGTSSRAMVFHRGKIYLSTIDELNSDNAKPYLYSSEDPEFFAWESLIDENAPGFRPRQNPQGAISNMAVFNDRLYVATSSPDGARVYRTNGPEPKMNDWTLIVDRGFGDPANKYTLAIGVFRDYLYVSGTKRLPLSWLLPMGCDVIRIDRRDRWQLVVGGNPLFTLPVLSAQDSPQAAAPEEADAQANGPAVLAPQRAQPLSGLGSGFGNPFNVYAWQIQEYKNRLYISTFDDSSNMEVILDTLLANRFQLYLIIGELITNALIAVYRSVVAILRAVNYPIGFDLYVSDDGVHFRRIVKRGLSNPNNYGGRLLFKSRENTLYLGTANPFQGCEVWTIDYDDVCTEDPRDTSDPDGLFAVRDEINKQFEKVSENLPALSRLFPGGTL